MIISQARIVMGDGSYPGDMICSAISLTDEQDQIVNSYISGGEIVSWPDIWFNQCYFSGMKPVDAIEKLPSKKMAEIRSCRIDDTILPKKAHYTMCYFQEGCIGSD